MQRKEEIRIDDLIKLSGFFVSLEEKEVFEKELKDFLEYSKIVNRIDLSNIETASHAINKEQLFRDDEVEKFKNVDIIKTSSEYYSENGFIVPPQKKEISRREGKKEEAKVEKREKDYEAVIGLEVHAQLKTNSKLFCSCSTEFGREPNSNICPICSGHPGVLPVLNIEAVKMAIKAGLALNCIINKKSVFARKNYFYPDLPKAYQISQYDEPLCKNGYIEIESNNGIKKVRINRIHLEEDAGKLVHIGAPGIWGAKASAVDFNRSGIPLIEIVTEPDINSAKEAKEFVVTLRNILIFLDVCDGNMEEGSLRCDANISIRPRGSTVLGTKVEIKNMNSFRAIERAIDYEINRQLQLVKEGKNVEQETRLWDDSSLKTILMRTKEESHDYRYFPEPDLMPLIVDEDLITECKKYIGISLLERKKKYIEEFRLTVDEANILISNPEYSKFFEAICKIYRNTRNVANWFFNEILSYLSKNKRLHIEPQDFAEFLLYIDQDRISGKIGKYVIAKAFETNRGLIEIIVEEKLSQISDRKIIEEIIIKVIEKYNKEVQEYKQGKKNIFGFLVGIVMKETEGKANPKIVNEILKEKLNKLS